MQKITAFYMEGCPYCRQARKALGELQAEDGKYQAASIDWIEENEHPEISGKYEYYYVPSMFIDGKKLYEAHPGESFSECKGNVRRVLEASLL